MSERHIELVWRCSSCRGQNLGRFTVCQTCGNPKDDSEEYEMPADPSAVASVTDPALLGLARAGANWSCLYCRSEQRAPDGTCANCGANRAVPPVPKAASSPSLEPTPGASEPAAAKAATADQAAPATTDSSAHGCGALFVVLAFVLGLGACGWKCVSCVRGGAKPEEKDTTSTPLPTPTARPPRTDSTALVEDVSWTRSTTLQRWQLVPHEAFASDVPAGAVAVRSEGQRVHHYDDVFDHEETVYTTVEVPDGYKTESYTENVACGENCTTTRRSCKQKCSGSPRKCNEVCTNKKNGFASCKTVCTGGDERCREECTGGERTCTTKYCDERRTRKVPKTRTESRPRVERRYRQVPRYAPWSSFKSWEWADVRTEQTFGHDTSPRWPDVDRAAGSPKPAARPVVFVSSPDGPPPANAAAPGKPGSERELRSETLSVIFRTAGGARYSYVPSSAEEFATLNVGASRDVAVIDGHLTLRR